MTREAFQCVKQVGYMLLAREDIKTGDIFVGESDDNKFVLQLVVYR